MFYRSADTRAGICALDRCRPGDNWRSNNLLQASLNGEEIGIHIRDSSEDEKYFLRCPDALISRKGLSFVYAKGSMCDPNPASEAGKAIVSCYIFPCFIIV
jgi:hypothetical protein